MPTPRLYLGNKNYSSWSLRPWLALKWGRIAFEEQVVPLGGEGYGSAAMKSVRDVSPSGRVPVLHVDGVRIWDSLAIGEWAAERSTDLWPNDPLDRAVARAVVCEMHSSFAALRRDLTMNIRRRTPTRTWPDDTQRDIARVLDVWSALRVEHAAKGPFLFGRRSLADAFYAPVCTRFRTYGVMLTGDAQAYVETIFSDESFLEWERDAIAEPHAMAQFDQA